MTDGNWTKVREVFDAALQHKPEARGDYIRSACGDDKVLLTEVESLFSSFDQSDKFLETPAVAHVADVIKFGTKPLEPGTRLGHCEIIRQIGIGGMGEVYLANDQNLDRQVAIKVLNEQFSHDESSLRRFVREAKTASALNHPNILVIHETGKREGTPYIVSEFVEGKTLREVLTQSRMSLREVLDVSIQVACALSAAHGAQLVHRDIKPENVMVRPDGYVKLLDFGLAKLVAEKNQSFLSTAELTAGQNQTAQGQILGTVNYMSPEQARGEEVDERTDIWSLGVMLYEMVGGSAPFTGEAPSHLIISIIENEPAPLASYLEVPGELQRIVTRTLRKNKNERYQTAGELALDLKNLKQELEVQARLNTSQGTDPLAVPLSGSWLRGWETSSAEGRPSGAQPLRVTSSVEYLVNEFSRHKLGVALAGAFLTITIMAVTYLYFGIGRDVASSNDAIHSIAVLPLVNVNNDPDTEYLSDGISESLINNLSQLPELKVIARSSSFKYKGKSTEPQEAGRALGVEGILTGRIGQRGEELLISVELVDARDQTHVWGAQYNRKASDLLAVQSEISQDIAEKLRLRLTKGEQQQLVKDKNVNPQAYELLLRGRFQLGKGGTENRKKAVEYFHEAIRVDPAYALAYAELSDCYNNLVNNNELDAKEFLPKAEEAARKAVRLDEDLAEAHLAMAWVKLSAWEWSAAEQDFKRAIELNPNLSKAHSTYMYYLVIQGRDEQAIAEAKRSRELDPLSSGANQATFYSLLLAHQYDQALETAKSMIEMNPGNPGPHVLLGTAYEAKGQYPELIAAFQEAIRLGDNSADTHIYLGAAYAKVGEREKTRRILRRLETGKDYVSPLGFAILHTALGEHDQAFALLEKAYAAHDQQLIWLGVESRGERGKFYPLRSDPRFNHLMQRIGLAQ